MVVKQVLLKVVMKKVSFLHTQICISFMGQTDFKMKFLNAKLKKKKASVFRNLYKLV